MREVRWVDAGRAAAAVAGLVTLAAYAGSVSQSIVVKVNLVSSSGTCSLTGGPQAVGVECGGGGGGVIPGVPAAPTEPGLPGSLPPVTQLPPTSDPARNSGQVATVAAGGRFQPVTTLPAVAGTSGPLTVYSGGVNISGWRVVSLDNEKYVELTIAW